MSAIQPETKPVSSFRLATPAPSYAKTRWPAAVYATGEDPDPRFTFSNERTLLAWIRTGLALSAAGIAIGTFVQEFSRPLRVSLAASLLLAASVSCLGGFVRWVRSEQALRTKRPLPSPLLAAGLAFAIGLVGVVSLVGVLSHPG